MKIIEVTSIDNDRSAGLQDLLVKAREAEARYDHETAVAAYTTALELPDLTPEEQVQILDGRSTAYMRWGDAVALTNDLKALVDAARRTGDKRTLAEALAVGGFYWAEYGDGDPSTGFIEEATVLTETLADDRLVGYAGLLQVVNLWWNEDKNIAWELLRNSLALAESSGDNDLLFESTRLISFAHAWLNQHDDADSFAGRARLLAEESGDFFKQSVAFTYSGIAVTDLASVRNYDEAAFRAAHAANFRGSNLANNMALTLWRLGLYGRALAYAKEAIEQAESLADWGSVAVAMDGLGRSYLGKGMLEDAWNAFHRGYEMDKKNPDSQAFNVYGLAEAALAQGHPETAVSYYHLVRDTFNMLRPVTLAGLGAATLAMGDHEQALAFSTEAVETLQTKQIHEYYAQEIWWRHYQVLQATEDRESFDALDTAKRMMLDMIKTLSDEGLRRNYLNKVAVNRDITLAWTAEAHKRGIPLDPFTKHEPLTGQLREQFRRVVDIGARLTAQHDPQTLADFIVGEFVEMSGAERVLLLTEDENGDVVTAASFNPEDAADIAAPLLDSMRYNRQPMLIHDAYEAPAGEIPELHLRSLVALPLVASDRFLGLLYGDLRQIFGRFNDSDVQLLGMLANQAAAALQNTDLVATLEERVTIRTAELQTANEKLAERNNELAVINSVQSGLAAQLDLQAIYDLVGDKLYEILDTQGLGITIFDQEAQTSTEVYSIEDGQHYPLQTHPFGPGAHKMVKDKRPLHFSNLEEIKSMYPNWEEKAVEGTNFSQSLIYVPLIVGDEVMGIIDLQDDRPNAYSDSDLRLVVTLASSMSLALENARLYGEAGEARALAEEANAAKSTFISNMSHELRTPLNAILGFTRIVRRKARGKLPEKQVDNLGKVLTSGEHLLGLINTILDIAKIEAGRMDIINTRFQIGPLIEAITMVSQPLFKPSVDLHLDIADGLPELYSDQDKIKQILLNLLSNAAKFTHEGSITVHAHVGAPSMGAPSVGALREAPLHNLPHLQIDVADTGIGMSEQALGRVFEEFQQADATTRKKYGGTGLGMPISKHLAQLLGGDLTVTSSPGEGSTFILTLPVQEENS